MEVIIAELTSRGLLTVYRKILLPLDLSNAKSQRKAVKTAVEMAQTFNSTLHIMTVVPDYGMSIVGSYFPVDHEQTMIADTKKNLAAFVAKNVPESVRKKQVVAHGSIYSEILDYANKSKVNLIVMASHRPELKDYLIGPNASRVVRHANCSTMVVRA